MTIKAESVKAPRFFGGGLSRNGRKCFTMKRNLEVAAILEVGVKQNRRKCFIMKRKLIAKTALQG
jgi:hypothetical protein